MGKQRECVAGDRQTFTTDRDDSVDIGVCDQVLIWYEAYMMDSVNAAKYLCITLP